MSKFIVTGGAGFTLTPVAHGIKFSFVFIEVLNYFYL